MQLIAAINRERIQGKLTLFSPAFYLLEKLILILMDSAYSARDLSTLLICLTAAPAISLKDSNPPVSLHSIILQETAVTDPSCWEALLKASIDQVFANFADMCLETQENTEVKAKIRGVVFAQLAAFGHLMQTYKRPAQEAKVLLEACALQFGLTPYHLSFILVSDI